MTTLQPTTGANAGLSRDEQIRIALTSIAEHGGIAQMSDIYAAVEGVLAPNGYTLCKQGRDSLRKFVNTDAVMAGYLHKESPGWRLTAPGREFLETNIEPVETIINVEKGTEESVPSETARGDAFELYSARILRAAYPNHAWYHQGRNKRRERGVDFVGNRLGNAHGEPGSIGVQVKFHNATNAPTEREWLKFLAGCFSRQLDTALFITTGKLTGEQRREAQEARVIVIEGRDEVTRLAAQHGIPRFELLDNEPNA